MKKNFMVPFATLALFGIALTSCGGTRRANVNDSTVLGTIKNNSSFITEQINFYNGNVYEYISTEIIYGYNMLLGTTTMVNYGTYEVGASEDGFTSYTLNQASEVIFNSFSLMGGYNISINTASSKQEYPVELLAQTQGEKTYAENKDAVIDAYGTGRVVYLDDKNTFTHTNPNDDTAEPVLVDTPSGSVKGVLNKELTNIQLASEIVSVGEMAMYNVYQVMTTDDGAYQHITTSITFGYSMLLGTTITVSFGTCTYGESEDGYTPLTLNRADDVVFNSYSSQGGYNISINTSSADQEYPVELLAQTQGEKTYAQNKAEVIDAYGQAVTYYSNDEANNMSLTNPNE